MTQCLKTYLPVFLLPICGESFEKLIFNELFKFFIKNELISPNQLGFKPGDSCTNHLLTITNDVLLHRIEHEFFFLLL